MRKVLVFVLASLLLGAGAVWLLRFGSGYVLVSYAGWTMEMSVWTASFLLFFTIWFIVWGWLLLHWIAGAGGFRAWWHSRRSMRHLNRTAQGLLLYAEDDWSGAAATLEQSARKSSMPVVNLLYAARSAANNEQLAQARRLIGEVRETYPDFSALADKTLAEVLLEQGVLDEAAQLLQRLQQQVPDNRAVLRLLAKCYWQQEEWALLEQMLPDMRRYKVLPAAKLDQFERQVYRNLLLTFYATTLGSADERRRKLGELWKSVPKQLQRNADLVVAYAGALRESDATGELEQLLPAALNRDWDPRLVSLFGRTAFASGEKQLAQGEKWLQTHQSDAELLLALGRICHRLGFRGKARDYFQSARSVTSSAEAHMELAKLLEEGGETSSSLQVYREGMHNIVSEQAANR